MSDPAAVEPEDETIYCARHPNVETRLRCGRCETPICPRCLVPTPVGARCPTCARVKRIAFLAKPRDFALGGLLGLLTATFGAILVGFIPFLGIIGLAILGFATGEAVSIGARRKRAPELGVLAIVCLVLGYAVLSVLVRLAFGALTGGRALPLELLPGFLLGVPLALITNPFALVGLGVGALLAWMRVR
jgi:hypothetical protein